MGTDLKGKNLGEGITQRKDGLFYARIKKSGHTVGKYFKKLQEAKRWRATAVQEDNLDSIYSSGDMILNAWFDYWMERYKTGKIAKKTENDYSDLYRIHIKPQIGTMKLEKIKSIHCNEVLNVMMKNKMSDSTIKKAKTLMHNIFECALENELIEKNPITRNVTAKGEVKKDKYIMTEQEQEAFIETAMKSCHYTVFAFILQTGLRYGEMTGLKWEDIDWENRTLSITRSADWDKQQQRFVEKPPKTQAGYRNIPLSEEAIKLLKIQKEKDEKIPVVIGYHNYVFRNSNGTLNHKTTLNKSLKRIAKKVGIPPISLHGLRHTFATRCIERRVNPKMLQKIMGHSKISVTMDIYAHATNEAVIEEFKKFENGSLRRCVKRCVNGV